MSDHACACGGSCGCGNGGSHAHTQRAPLSREEYIARLEMYLEDLKTEIEAVEEELVQLRREVNPVP